MRQLERWQWMYVLRQKPNNLVQLPGGDWQSFDNLVQKDGQSFWLGQGLLTAKHAYPLNLLAHWKRGEKEPWLLATNLNSRQETLKAYGTVIFRPIISQVFSPKVYHQFSPKCYQ